MEPGCLMMLFFPFLAFKACSKVVDDTIAEAEAQEAEERERAEEEERQKHEERTRRRPKTGRRRGHLAVVEDEPDEPDWFAVDDLEDDGL